MRTFKFRAWDNKRKFMDDVWCIDTEHDEVSFSHHNASYLQDCDIMQCTGLKDIDGVDIYEGDIIEDNVMQGTKDPNVWELVDLRMVIKWNESVGAFMRYRGKYGYGYLVNNKRPKVVGNIYEDWDLIKDDKFTTGERIYEQDEHERV